MDLVRSAVRVVGRPLGVGALLALLVFVMVGSQHPLEKGLPAPPVHGRALDGAIVDDLHFEGKITVVNIWASWCPPCLGEIPEFVRASRTYADRVRFVGLAADSPRDDVVRLVERFGIPYDVAQIDGATSTAWGATALPSTYIVDAQGKIAWSMRGQIDGKLLSGALDHILTP